MKGKENGEKLMKIEQISIESLVPYENNPRQNDEAASRLQISIKEFGFRVPLLVDSNNVIVAGHTRYKAAKALGMSELPCIRVEGLNESQIKAFRIADNKYSELSHWDNDLLKGELEFLKDIDFDLESIGFNAYELQSFLEPFTFSYDASEESDEIEIEGTSCEKTFEKSRIIITYEGDEEYEFLVERLGISEDKSKVSYKAKDLMKD